MNKTLWIAAPFAITLAATPLAHGGALSDLASTRKACPTSTIEGRYLDALKASDHFRIDGELLTLFDKDDEAVASFQAIYL